MHPSAFRDAAGGGRLASVLTSAAKSCHQAFCARGVQPPTGRLACGYRVACSHSAVVRCDGRGRLARLFDGAVEMPRYQRGLRIRTRYSPVSTCEVIR